MSRLIEALRRLDALSGSVAGKFLPTSAPVTVSEALAPPPELQIPCIREELQTIGVSSRDVERLLELYDRKAVEIQKIFEANWVKLSSQLAPLFSNSHISPMKDKILEQRTSLHRQRFDKSIQEHAGKILQRAQELRELEVQSSSQPRFRACFRPLLERYYLMESHPNRKAKETLARKTGMNYRQIHVWFQNRRARAKRDGEDLRRPIRSASRFSGGLDLSVERYSSCLHLEENGNPESDQDEDQQNIIADLAVKNREQDNRLDLQITCVSRTTPARHHDSSSTVLNVVTPNRSLSSGLFRRDVPKPSRETPAWHQILDSMNGPFNAMCIGTDIDLHTDELYVSRKLYVESLDIYQGSCSLLQFHHSSLESSPKGCIRVSSAAASRSFSQAFESQEPSLLGSVNNNHEPSRSKRRRTTDTMLEASSLMSLAEICSATTPIKISKIAAFPHRIPTSLSDIHHFLHFSTSPSSTMTPPLSPAESLAPSSPPSSPFSHAPSLSSESSDHLFSSGSISTPSSAISPLSPSIDLPYSRSIPSSIDPPSPAYSTFTDEPFDVESTINPVSLYNNTFSLPESSLQVPRLVRKVAVHSGHFAATSAQNMLQLEF